jgi:hypothetical protein
MPSACNTSNGDLRTPPRGAKKTSSASVYLTSSRNGSRFSVLHLDAVVVVVVVVSPSDSKDERAQSLRALIWSRGTEAGGRAGEVAPMYVKQLCALARVRRWERSTEWDNARRRRRPCRQRKVDAHT